jgi:hypothetical protein
MTSLIHRGQARPSRRAIRPRWDAVATVNGLATRNRPDASRSPVHSRPRSVLHREGPVSTRPLVNEAGVRQLPTCGSSGRPPSRAARIAERWWNSLIDQEELGHDSGVGQARQLMMSMESMEPRGVGIGTARTIKRSRRSGLDPLKQPRPPLARCSAGSASNRDAGQVHSANQSYLKGRRSLC